MASASASAAWSGSCGVVKSGHRLHAGELGWCLRGATDLRPYVVEALGQGDRTTWANQALGDEALSGATAQPGSRIPGYRVSGRGQVPAAHRECHLHGQRGHGGVDHRAIEIAGPAHIDIFQRAMPDWLETSHDHRPS